MNIAGASADPLGLIAPTRPRRSRTVAEIAASRSLQQSKGLPVSSQFSAGSSRGGAAALSPTQSTAGLAAAPQTFSLHSFRLDSMPEPNVYSLLARNSASRDIAADPSGSQ